MLARFPIAKTHLFPVIGLSLIAVLAHTVFSSAVDLFSYNSVHVDSGEWWRLISAHFYHTNTVHLLLNVAGLLLLWALHGEYYDYQSLTVVFAISSLGCSLGLLYFSPQLISYVGMSGVLHGLFVWGALYDVKQNRWSGFGLIIGIALKIGSEQWSGASTTLAHWIDASIAIDAHLYGALSGLVAFGLTSVTSIGPSTQDSNRPK